MFHIVVKFVFKVTKPLHMVSHNRYTLMVMRVFSNDILNFETRNPM